MSDRNGFSQTARTLRRSAEAASEVLARRVYEICVARGYVDGRDWSEAEAELRGEPGFPPGDQGAREPARSGAR